VLINNAGALFATRQVTEDGLEYTFALNHMAYFVVTEDLRERLAASASTHCQHCFRCPSRRNTGFRRFAVGEKLQRHQSVLFTRELARRLHGTGVTANCLHPGFVATRFADQSDGLISRFVWLAKFFAISPEKGAKTIVHLASSPNVAGMTGKYFDECHATTPSLPARDDRAASLLWERSAALAGMSA